MKLAKMNWLLRKTLPGFGHVNVQEKERSNISQMFFSMQVLPTTCAAQPVTSSTLIITAWTRTWSSHYATISSPHHTTPTWWVTSWCHSPEWTCTPGCCRPAAAVSKVSMSTQFLFFIFIFFFIWPRIRSINECQLKPQLTVGTAQTENRWFTTDTHSPPRFCSETSLRPSTSMPSSRMSTSIHAFTCTCVHSYEATNVCHW